MKKVFCPKCAQPLSFDESKYPEGKVLAFLCPRCGARFKVKLGRKEARPAEEEERAAADRVMQSRRPDAEISEIFEKENKQ